MKASEVRRWEIQSVASIGAAQPNYSIILLTSWTPSRYIYIRDVSCAIIIQTPVTLVSRYMPCGVTVVAGSSTTSINQPVSSKDYTINPITTSINEQFNAKWDASEAGEVRPFPLMLNQGSPYQLQVDGYGALILNDSVNVIFAMHYSIYNSPEDAQY